jgi:hypothetical protein
MVQNMEKTVGAFEKLVGNLGGKISGTLRGSPVSYLE